MNELQRKDLQYIWHPCSQMKDYEEMPPIVVERGKGAYLYDIEGHSYLDAVSSWWVNLFGHSNDRINSALKKQVDQLEHVIFAQFTHKPAIELAEKLVQMTPSNLQKVFFADNGSSAIEVALKLSFQYFQQIGKQNKTKFVSITDAYHGETLGALSVSNIGLYNEIYQPLLMNTFEVQGPDCFRCSYQKDREHCNAECFEKMEEIVSKEHDNICAVVIEPMVQGAAGMKIYSKHYLKKLRKLCDTYDIHLIADEIAVGFGRTGTMFACNHAEIEPDIMCLSKGITAGYMPLAVTLTTEKIYQVFYDDYIKLKAFMHSHSYTGNPLSCAVACETLKIFDEENILQNNAAKSSLIKELVASQLNSHPYVGEFRQLGMIGAIELVKNKKTKEPFPWTQRVGYEIYKIALSKGLLIRPLGNIIYFMPPYCVEEKDLEFMVSTTFDCINNYFNR